MFASMFFWAALGYCGDRPVPPIPIPGEPGPPPPDPFRFWRVPIALAGGLAGGYLGHTFLEPSLAVSGLAAFAAGRVFGGLSRVWLSPHPLPPKEVRS